MRRHVLRRTGQGGARGRRRRLLLRIASAAHGIAVFLRQGLFGVSADALDQTSTRAARTARDIPRNSPGSATD
ncbi:hypothetical protein [Streptomyces sasae]|uniref:hypothetical protein n=1 Tax=Streptomyces sasae TaxID=1266772 RepID=UPI0029311BF2|nr:hypothetical protein [Streptomyces sasae]